MPESNKCFFFAECQKFYRPVIPYNLSIGANTIIPRSVRTKYCISAIYMLIPDRKSEMSKRAQLILIIYYILRKINIPYLL